jgi:hypothetical protein
LYGAGGPPWSQGADNDCLPMRGSFDAATQDPPLDPLTVRSSGRTSCSRLCGPVPATCIKRPKSGHAVFRVCVCVCTRTHVYMCVVSVCSPAASASHNPPEYSRRIERDTRPWEIISSRSSSRGGTSQFELVVLAFEDVLRLHVLHAHLVSGTRSSIGHSFYDGYSTETERTKCAIPCL